VEEKEMMMTITMMKEVMMVGETMTMMMEKGTTARLVFTPFSTHDFEPNRL
jgi:hypothetical protein